MNVLESWSDLGGEVSMPSRGTEHIGWLNRCLLKELCFSDLHDTKIFPALFPPFPPLILDLNIQLSKRHFLFSQSELIFVFSHLPPTALLPYKTKQAFALLEFPALFNCPPVHQFRTWEIDFFKILFMKERERE